MGPSARRLATLWRTHTAAPPNLPLADFLVPGVCARFAAAHAPAFTADPDLRWCVF